jgi:cysteine-rich repeat protein
MSRFALLSLLLTLGLVIDSASDGRASALQQPASIRVQIRLDLLALPPEDRERSRDRLSAIEESIAAGLPLFRSFDAREVLAESLADLAGLGADLGPSAVVNFDSLETTIPESSREAIAALPWVRRVGAPTRASASGLIDSEGVPQIGATAAHVLGIAGQGITVAIIDDGFNHLNATIADGNDELAPIPTSAQHRVNRAATAAVTPIALNGTATQTLHGEHGTACAEVVYEVAPQASFLLIGFQAQLSGNQHEGGVSSAQIQFAIRRAAELGARVILVPMFLFETMSDPIGVGQGGTNVFTDDVDYATALGATVVVAAGNEELRHVEETFSPCLDCTNGPSGQCANASDDTDYHAWDPFSEGLPLNDLLFVSEVDFAEEAQLLSCYSATDAADPSQFEMRLVRFHDPNFLCDFPGCPGDCGMTAVAGATVTLGEGFTRKDLPLYDATFEEFQYFLTVRRKGGTETPRIRVACTTGVEELYWATETGRSLSDLAVVSSAVAVGALDAFGDLFFESSRGPSGLSGGPIKPDLVAPGEVSNFTVFDYAVSDSSDFVGTSAAAAHVAGIVALVQSRALVEDGAPLSPAAVKLALQDAAIDLGSPGHDTDFGAGLVQFPLASSECGNGSIEAGEECDDGNAVSGDCCSAACESEPAGLSCADADVCDGAETCDGAGHCQGGMPLVCDDGDACTRDECDPGAGCLHEPRPATNCADAWGNALLVVDERISGKEHLTATLGRGPSLSPLAFGDPLLPGGTAYSVCIYDDLDALVGRIDVDRAGAACDATECWKRLRPAGYRYKDKDGTADGVRLVKLKAGATGKSAVKVAGENAAARAQTSLPTGIAAALAGATKATLQVFRSDDSQCFSASLGRVLKSEPTLFKAKR